MSLILLDENAVAPGAPALGKSIIYPKADGLWYSKDDVGVETPFAIPLPVSAANGGTGLAAYTIGDLLYASGAAALAKLAAPAAGQVLISNGVGVAPSWSASPSITTLTTTGAINGQTISNAANFTGTLAVAGTVSLTGLADLTGLTMTATTTSRPVLSFANAASGALGQVFFANDGLFEVRRNIGGNATLLQISAAGLLSVSGFGTHTFSAGGAGGNVLALRNTTAGAGNFAELKLGNDVAASAMQLYVLSSTYTSSGPDLASGTSLWATGSGGLSIVANHASGVIRFYSGSSTERGRFQAGGQLTIGNTLTANIDSGKLGISFDSVAGQGIAIKDSQTSFGGYYVYFTDSGGAAAGNIAHTAATTVAYNTTSDQRLKHDLGLATDLSGLRAAKVHDFTWKRDGVEARGVFAQEAHLTSPLVVTRGSDALKDDGQLANPWSVDYSKFVPDLIVGWQQHEARLAALEGLSHA